MVSLMQREVVITAFVCRFDRGKIAIPGPIVAYFDTPGVKLCVKVQKEILLACEPTKTSINIELQQGVLTLPEAAVAKLCLADGDCVAMIERRNAFAFKRIPPGLL
jgi:hypothetical protein